VLETIGLCLRLVAIPERLAGRNYGHCFTKEYRLDENLRLGGNYD
jgi:hypothetical protein